VQVGLNSNRVLRHRERRRLATAPVLHSDMSHLASNCTALLVEGLPLEARLGTPGFLALVASTCAASHALYRECSELLSAASVHACCMKRSLLVPGS
jgi:membrane associated rhomboid family serine protease